jgi:hypothetical protein
MKAEGEKINVRQRRRSVQVFSVIRTADRQRGQPTAPINPPFGGRLWNFYVSS